MTTNETPHASDATTTNIAVNGITLSVYDSGSPRDADLDSPILVFLHHYGGAGRTWTEVIAQLSGGFQCIAPDTRGFGGSSPAPTPDGYRVDDYADDVSALVAALGLRRYVLIGHSMGGKIALAVAARAPIAGDPTLAALVLVAPSPSSPEPMTQADRADTRAAYGDREKAARMITKIVAHPLVSRIEARTIDDMTRASRAAWEAWLDSGSRENLVDRMPRINVPTLVVAGASDSVITVDLLRREVIARVSGANLVILTDTGHLSPLESPDAVAGHIRDALHML